MKDPDYLQFIRSRPCTFCGDPRTTEPHHPIRRLRGISESGLAQKGADYLGIPICRRHHTQLHDGNLHISREELLEVIVANLVCYLDATAEKLHREHVTKET